MGAVGYIFALAVIKLLVKKEDNPDYTLVFSLVALLMIVSVVILVITIREKKLAAQMAEQASIGEKAEETQPENKTTGPLPKDVRQSLVFLLASIFLWFTAYNADNCIFPLCRRSLGSQGRRLCRFTDDCRAAAVVSYIPIGMIASAIGRKDYYYRNTDDVGNLFMRVFFLHTPDQCGIRFYGFGWSAHVNSYPMVVEMSRSRDVGSIPDIIIPSPWQHDLYPDFSGFLLKIYLIGHYSPMQLYFLTVPLYHADG